MVTYSPPIRALLVEDDESDARLVAERLTNFASGEFLLDRAGTLRGGIELAGARPYAVAVLDLHLPDGSGSGVWREFQSAATSTRTLVVLTGEEDRALEAQAVREGVQDFLLKSYTSGAGLARALRHAIARESRVSSLRRQHLELMASEARIRNLMVASAEGLAVVDQTGKIVFINEQAARWTGLSIDEATGVQFPLDVPMGRIGRADVAVDDPGELDTNGIQRVRLARLELRAVPSTWSGNPVAVVTMRDVTRQDADTSRLSLLTQLDRSIALASGDIAAVCETVADHLPRLIPYQQLEIAVSRVSGAPAEVVVQRGVVHPLGGHNAASFSVEESVASAALGDERFPRGWIAVSSRRKQAFDSSTADTLRHITAIVTASLGLAIGPRPGTSL